MTRSGISGAVRTATLLIALAVLSPPAPTQAEGETSGTTAAVESTPSSGTRLDLPTWIEFKSKRHLAALPREARLFYRRGLSLHGSGSEEEAIRMVRGAAELDPAYVAPHLTLAGWYVLREPSQALLQYASVLQMARDHFRFQLALTGNGLTLAFQSLFLALVAAGMIVVGLRHRALRHGWTERLSGWLSPATARAWSWAFLVVPYVAGLGPAVPTAVFLGLLWPSLKGRERTLFVLLVAAIGAAPLVTDAVDRLASPFRRDEAPLYGVPQVENESWSAERARDLATAAASHPENPYLQFAAAWTARRGGDVAAAAAGYRRVLQLRPNDARAMNNLGNALAMQGRFDEALEMYRGAVGRESGNAAAWFNASQIHTRRFDYHAATDALSRASALDFEMVKSYQAQTTDDGVLPLVDQWIAPHSLWAAMPHDVDPLGQPFLPPAWRGRIEASGWRFSLAGLLLALAALGFGLWQHRVMPLRSCSNCGTVVCRRCARRRREIALCPGCATIESRAQSPEFARVLLLQQRRKARRVTSLVRTAFAVLIPGFGLLAFRRLVMPLFLLSCAAALLTASWAGGGPFSYEPRVAESPESVPLALRAVAWAALYAVSWLGYAAEVARAEEREAALSAPIRARTAPASRHLSAAA